VTRNDTAATMMEVTGDFFLEAAPLLLPMPDGGGAFSIVIVIVGGVGGRRTAVEGGMWFGIGTTRSIVNFYCLVSHSILNFGLKYLPLWIFELLSIFSSSKI